MFNTRNNINPSYAAASNLRPVFNALQTTRHALGMFTQAFTSGQLPLATIFSQGIHGNFLQAFQELDNLSVSDAGYLPAVNELRRNLNEAMNTHGLYPAMQSIEQNLKQVETMALHKADVAFSSYGPWINNQAGVQFFTDFANFAFDPAVRNAAAMALRNYGVEPYAAQYQVYNPPLDALAGAQALLLLAQPQQQFVPAPFQYNQPMPMPMQVAQSAQVFAPPPPPVDPMEAVKRGYSALVRVQAQMEKALAVRHEPERLARAIHNLQIEIDGAKHHIASLKDYGALQGMLLRNYRTLLFSADKRCVNERITGSFAMALADHEVFFFAHDAEFLTKVETLLSQPGHSSDELEDLRIECNAISRYGLLDSLQSRAKGLLPALDMLPNAPARDTKRTLRRGVDNVAFPEGLDEVIEFRSLKGNTYYAEKSTDRGTFGKYRILVGADGKRWGMKVLRLESGSADGLRVALHDGKAINDLPTAGTLREAAEAEFDTIRAASENLDVEDVLEIDGKLYAVMTPMEDELHAAVKRVRERENFIAIVVSAFQQLTQETAKLHGKGRIHGDFKSKNALVAGTGLVALADFGTSKLISPRGNPRPFNNLVGTYPPPDFEQGWGKDADTWALGVMLINMLSTSRMDPFNYLTFTAGAVQSFKNWYAKIPRGRSGEMLIDRLPTKTSDDRVWTRHMDGALQAAPHPFRLALEGFLNPSPSARWGAVDMLGLLRVPDFVHNTAKEALKKMADEGKKEPRYELLKQFAQGMRHTPLPAATDASSVATTL